MPVKVYYNGDDVWCEPTEDSDTGFHLPYSTNNSLSITTPLSLDTRFSDKNFEIFFLAKKNVKENEIYQVHAREIGRRIGWIIPAVSLGSDLHDFAQDENFLAYAYIAIKESLCILNQDVYSNSLPSGDNANFIDIFHEKTILLVLSKETYGDNFQFNIDKATPTLSLIHI